MKNGEIEGQTSRKDIDKEEERREKREANTRYRRNENRFRPRRTNINNNP
jgi:hypothetical protein